MKTIIFDFGSVLVDWNPRHFYRSVFKTTEEMEWFLTHVCNEEWNSHHDAGVRFEDNQTGLIAQYPQYETQIKQYYVHWPDMLGDEIPGMWTVVNDLKEKGYKVYGLTNWSAQTFPIAYNKYRILRAMDGIVVSGEEKCIKPGAEIFKRLLDRFHLQAQDCVFIDDNIHNVAAAKALGFDTIHFAGAENLQEELHKRKIL